MSEFWNGRRVFVTGATGFLGGWAVKELLDQGAHVLVLLRDGTPRSMLVRDGLVEKVDSVSGDLASVDLLRRTFAEYEVQTIFHLAAQAIVGVAKKDPVGTLEANVRGTWNLLEAGRQVGVEQIVVASSDKAYGSAPEMPYVEGHPLNGEFPYDVSKSCADLICRMYARTYELPVAVTRCGNLFGGGDLNFSRTVPGVIRSTLRREPFVIRSDGHYVRDFLYVRDAVLGYVRLAEKLAENTSELAGEAFNLSLETKLTVLELVNMVLEKLDASDIEPVIQNQASTEIRVQYMSAEKAHRLLDWTPTYGMDGGLDESIDWYRKFLADHGELPA